MRNEQGKVSLYRGKGIRIALIEKGLGTIETCGERMDMGKGIWYNSDK